MSRRLRMLLLGAVLMASAPGCTGDQDVTIVPAPSTSPTRWVRSDLRVGDPATIRRAAARLAITCHEKMSALAGTAVSAIMFAGAQSPRLPDAVATQLACALDAPASATCADMMACAGSGLSATETPHCNGQTLVALRARDRRPITVACRGFGDKCFDTLVGAICGSSACGEGETYACEGSSIVACMQGVRQRQPCGRGMKCGERSQSALVDCVGTGPECTQERCDGDIAVKCLGVETSEGRETPLDCASWGMRCDLNAQKVAACIPKTECDSLHDPATCSGGKLKMCVGGSFWTSACSSIVPGSTCRESQGNQGEATCSLD